MKLFIFDFIISHKLNKMNFIDTSSRRLNYKSENELINKFLFIL